MGLLMLSGHIDLDELDRWIRVGWPRRRGASVPYPDSEDCGRALASARGRLHLARLSGQNRANARRVRLVSVSGTGGILRTATAIDKEFDMIRRFVVGLAGLYVLFAVMGRFVEGMGAVHCGCAMTCWCKRPVLSLFRWVFPWGHAPKTYE